jgi:phosphohistidine swiveling domain-containing protein
MVSPYFRSENEIKKTASGIIKLFSDWGMAEDEWMVGKQMSFFLAGIIKNPKEILRDTNLYVLYKKLPWRTTDIARLFPPKNSEFYRQYMKAQRDFNVGIDLMPVPDGRSIKEGFITKNKMMVSISDKNINVESPEKFIDRSIGMFKFFKDKPETEAKDFYFADKDRYQKRMSLYKKIRNGLTDKKVIAKLDFVIEKYDTLTKQLYPEIFDERLLDKTNLAGKKAFANQGVVEGIVAVYNPKKKYNKRGQIFVFSHFYPADTKVLPFAKAVLTEGGGVLSHAAIVCREYKIPCMVGVRGLTKAVKNGQKIRIDFNNEKIIT